MGGVRRSPAGPDGRKCQKKVTQNQDGQWFCESCGKAFPAPAYRYMLNLEVVDYTESRYVSKFNDEAERLLGMKAEEINALQLSNSEAYERVFQNALLKEFVMTLRVKVRLRGAGEA